MNSKYPDSPNGEKNVHAVQKAEDHGRHVIVASEPSTYKEDDWTLIEKNHCVLVGENGVRIEEFEIPTALNSTVKSL